MARKVIAEHISIGRRYVRAVDILRDLEDTRALEGYVLTPSVRDGLRRVLAGLETGSSQRAFRVTGPYGSGKSSFGLLLARLFHEQSGSGPATNLCQELLGEKKMPLYRPLAVVGRHASLTMDLAESIRDVARIEFGENNEIVASTERALKKQRAKGGNDAKAVIDCLERCSKKLRDKTSRGLLLLIDEMGRYVEFAVSNPNLEDASIFQQLAERAGGARDNGLAVICFLHHRFGDYVATLGDWVEGEWRRTSERYEEIAFHESHEQLLYLLSEALTARRPHSSIVTAAARSLYRDAGKRGLFTLPKADLVATGEQLYPFHPGALSCLWLCSRRLGQNERSVFSFLQSSEPFGYQDFAHRTNYGGKNWYRIDDVYDHLASQGSLKFQTKDREKRWEMGQDALLLSGDLAIESRRVLKAVSLIAVLEPVPGMSTEIDSLAWLLGLGRGTVKDALAELAKRTVIHKRESQKDWSLWSHSSVDLERWMDKAKTAIPEMRRLEEELFQITSLRPIVAQRHYHRTGTLRSFAVRIGEVNGEFSSGFDGLVVVRPIYPEEESAKIRQEAARMSNLLGPLALVRMQPITPGLLVVARNHSCWRWIQMNCGELRIDDFAREEVERRIRNLENELRGALLPFGYANADAPGIEWFYEGEVVQIESRTALNRFLSDVCDKVFDKAPILRNELINRDKLSSAVAASRMRLLGLMLEKEEKEYLGLAGTPPERTIYLSMFHASGMHNFVNDSLRFRDPGSHDPLGWGFAWRLVDNSAKSGESIGVDAVITKLGQPPIGLREGPALLLIAAYMLRHRSNIALMERGSFQPEITQAHFMRLAKSPKNFALHRIGTVENEEAIRCLAEKVSILVDDCPGTNIKDVVEALYRWWGRLSEFAKGTQTVGPTTRNVRSALRKAKEPIELVLNQLPRACDAVGSDGIDIERYVLKLDVALTELSDALPILRSKVEASILRAFGTRNLGELRRQMALDYKDHLLELGSYELRAFVDRVLKKDVDDEIWIDGVAGLVVGKRLEGWDDTLIDHFAFEIQGMAQKLSRRLALIREGNAQKSPVTSIHVTMSDGREQSLYLRDGPDDDAELLERIRDILAGARRPDAVLVNMLCEMMEQREQEDAE